MTSNRLANNERIVPLNAEAFNLNPQRLNLGWNQQLIEVVQGGGEWKFAGKFTCSNPAFLAKLEFAGEH